MSALSVHPLVCLVTGGSRITGGDTSPRGRLDGIVGQIVEAAHAGVDLVQVREPGLEAAVLTRLVATIVEAVKGTPARVLVNDRVDVALAADAHGVHLRADSCAAARVRSLAPAGFVVGRSVHTADEAAAVATAGGVDFLLFGTVFESRSKPDRRPAGLAALARVVDRAAGVPVVAIGGVTVATAPLVAAAGAAGVAAIGAFLPREPGAHGSIADTVAGLRRTFDTNMDVH